MELLTTRNFKTEKGEKFGFTTFILHLLPFTNNSKGINLCPHASEGCAASCLVGSGMGGMIPKVKNARAKRTEYFLSNRKLFLEQLYTEISVIYVKYNLKRVAIRLNGTSDIAWEKFKIKDNKNIFELFPEIAFYDYTKNHVRMEKYLKNELPKNYSLVFSKSETNTIKTFELLNKGASVAIVFDKIPETYNGFKVINGDESDLRFLDEKNVIIGLKYKILTGKNVNNKAAFNSGFAIRTIPEKVKKNKQYKLAA